MLTIGGWLRYPIIRRLIPADARSVLEIGCGRGATGAMLARDFDYRGVEPDPESYRAAAGLLDGRITNGTDQDIAGTADVVCAFEVLEHIDDDRAALQRWRDLVAPGGRLILSVPAHQRLYNRVDERVGHFRRYDPDRLAQLLSDAGFSNVDMRMYGFPLGNLTRWASGFVAHGGGTVRERTMESGRWLQPGERTAFIRRALAAPFAVAQRLFERTNLGVGIVAKADRT